MAGPDVTRSWFFGLAPLSLSLGGFVVPKVALLARVAGTSFIDGGSQAVANFYGVVAEVWPLDSLYLSGGVGLGMVGENPLFGHGAGAAIAPIVSRTDNVSFGRGWALDFRVGTALARGTNNDFTLSLEAIPGFYDGRTLTGLALVGAWKWY